MMRLNSISFRTNPAVSHGRLQNRPKVWTFMAVSVLGLMALSSGGVAAPPAAPLAAAPSSPPTISIKDFAFTPQMVTVPAGTTVTWKNLDDEPHTVRGVDAQIRSDALDQDESYSVKFDKPGYYKYGCSIHPKMSGTIVVQ